MLVTPFLESRQLQELTVNIQYFPTFVDILCDYWQSAAVLTSLIVYEYHGIRHPPTSLSMLDKLASHLTSVRRFAIGGNTLDWKGLQDRRLLTDTVNSLRSLTCNFRGVPFFSLQSSVTELDLRPQRQFMAEETAGTQQYIETINLTPAFFSQLQRLLLYLPEVVDASLCNALRAACTKLSALHIEGPNFHIYVRSYLSISRLKG
jgi:hypothetical protein